ncbi:DUF4347 domain-containing protein [Shewanella gelidimarina]|uniref:DUF4347 domain-containing protein n=1 Tax=Shewanella gelidimarina TaxID=56813 RepID=UPI00200CCD9D|nr:DUF4347 domain-containing protein [Shewanella gelidimarina]MCL1058770.1 DUF4347 domain-containing protein [Shewanella gelidimarina]
MDSLKHISTYSTFNDSLTHLSLFAESDSALDTEFDPALDIKTASAEIKFPRQFPLTWLILLCCLLFVNEATANERPTTSLLNVEHSAVLVIVDSTVQDLEGLLQNVRGEVHLLILDDDQEPFAQINQAIANEPSYIGVVMVASAASDAIYLGGRWIDKQYLVNHRVSVSQFGAHFSASSQFMILTNDSIANPKGDQLLHLITRLTQLDISAYGDTEHHYLSSGHTVRFF